MSWSVGRDDNWNRDIGYGVPAICDHPDCTQEIDRGLAHVCGGEPFGGDDGCGLFFCQKHKDHVCERCAAGKEPFKPKGDHPEWIKHKLLDGSWEQWRKMNPEWVKWAKERLYG